MAVNEANRDAPDGRIPKNVAVAFVSAVRDDREQPGVKRSGTPGPIAACFGSPSGTPRRARRLFPGIACRAEVRASLAGRRTVCHQEWNPPAPDATAETAGRP
jgi:hypothetical protein